jgi:hypothetical protein
MTIHHSSSKELQGRSDASEALLPHGEHVPFERRSQPDDLDLDDLVRAIRALLDS